MENQTNLQKIVLFGAGGAGIRLLHQLGEEKVYAFCDNYKAGQTIEKKPVIDVNALKEISGKERYKVIICVIAPHIACEIAEQLQENSIEYELCEECKARCEWDVMHIVDDEVVFLSDTFCSKNRKGKWYLLYKQMFDRFKEEFADKKIDFWVQLGDNADKAYWAVKLGVVESPTVFAFNTMSEFEDVVIPVPDYMYYALPGGIKYDDCIEEYRKNSRYPWECDKAFWIGNLNNHSSREKLYQLGKQYPDDLEIESYDWSESSRFVPMSEQYRYKYLIDAKGCGWTDRIKILFLLERPIFINERPYVEFWMKYGLENGKHYISVKEDFSDLLEKKRELDSSPEKYKKITEEMHSYAEKYLTKDFALEYLKDIILKHGTQERHSKTI